MGSKISKADDILQKMLSEKRIKSVEDKRVGSEVFDTITLKTLYKLANTGNLHSLNGAISTGKEANVFKGADEEDELVAVKIYRVTTSDFKKMQTYIQGDPRFRVRTTNKRQLINAWVNKEFRNLQRANDAGVRVPKPIIAKNNILIMEFIGDGEGNAALPMIYSDIKDPKSMLSKIIKYMKLLYQKAGLVHGDLSSYNILIQNDEPVIIDISQGMTRDHPIAQELLDRDIENIAKYFRKLNVDITFEEIKNEITD